MRRRPASSAVCFSPWLFPFCLLPSRRTIRSDATIIAENPERVLKRTSSESQEILRLQRLLRPRARLSAPLATVFRGSVPRTNPVPSTRAFRGSVPRGCENAVPHLVLAYEVRIVGLRADRVVASFLCRRIGSHSFWPVADGTDEKTEPFTLNCGREPARFILKSSVSYPKASKYILNSS